MRYSVLYLLIPLLLFSCKEEMSDSEKMETEVRKYYFLEDTAEVIVEVSDTMYLPNVLEMLNNVENNLGLIQLDIDTLSTIIDEVAYANLDSAKNINDVPDQITVNDYRLMRYRMKMQELEAKRLQYIHTRRVLNHLKRNSWSDIAGFNASVSFHLDGEYIEDEVLLNGEYEIVD